MLIARLATATPVGRMNNAESRLRECSTAPDCALIQWQTRFAVCRPIENCTSFAVSNYTQLDCQNYRVASYYDIEGDQMDLSYEYLSVGTSNNFQWTQATSIDTEFDPETVVMSRWIWSVDQQTLFSDSIIWELSTNVPGDPPTQRFAAATTRYTILDEKFILSEKANLSRNTNNPISPPAASASSVKLPRIL